MLLLEAFILIDSKGLQAFLAVYEEEIASVDCDFQFQDIIGHQ